MQQRIRILFAGYICRTQMASMPFPLSLALVPCSVKDRKSRNPTALTGQTMCTSVFVHFRRHTPYMGQPDYRIYELNKRLQQRTDVSILRHVFGTSPCFILKQNKREGKRTRASGLALCNFHAEQNRTLRTGQRKPNETTCGRKWKREFTRNLVCMQHQWRGRVVGGWLEVDDAAHLWCHWVRPKEQPERQGDSFPILEIWTNQRLRVKVGWVFGLPHLASGCPDPEVRPLGGHLIQGDGSKR